MDGIGALLADHTPSISDMLADTGLPEAVRNGLLMATGTAIGATLGGASGAASGFNEITNNGLFTAVIKRVGVPALIACLKEASCRALTGVTGVAIAAQVQQVLQAKPGMSEGNAFTVAITDLSNYGLTGRPATPLPGGGPTVTPGAAVQGNNTTAGNQTGNPGESGVNGGYAAGTQPAINPNTYSENQKINPPKQESPIWNGYDNAGNGRKSSGSGTKKEYYEWDNTHNDIEVYDRNGIHLGSNNPVTGLRYKDRVSGRRIDL